MAAVDGDHRTGHVTRRIGCQQQQRPVEVFQLAEPTLRNALHQRLARFGLEEIAVHVGPDITWRERIDANAITREFGGHRMGQMDETRL